MLQKFCKMSGMLCSFVAIAHPSACVGSELFAVGRVSPRGGKENGSPLPSSVQLLAFSCRGRNQASEQRPHVGDGVDHVRNLRS